MIDIPDLIAGALGVSRGTAYDLMREALAEQPAHQEPVWDASAPLVMTPHPAFQQPAQQEPVQRYSLDGEGGMEIDSLGAWVKFIPPQPAQRKPLTDEEIWELAATCLDSVAGRMQFARAIEAAHGIKEQS